MRGGRSADAAGQQRRHRPRRALLGPQPGAGHRPDHGHQRAGADVRHPRLPPGHDGRRRPAAPDPQHRLRRRHRVQPQDERLRGVQVGGDRLERLAPAGTRTAGLRPPQGDDVLPQLHLHRDVRRRPRAAADTPDDTGGRRGPGLAGHHRRTAAADRPGDRAAGEGPARPAAGAGLGLCGRKGLRDLLHHGQVHRRGTRRRAPDELPGTSSRGSGPRPAPTCSPPTAPWASRSSRR